MRWVVNEIHQKFMEKRVKSVVYQGSSAVVENLCNMSRALGSISSKPHHRLMEKKGSDTLAKATCQVEETKIMSKLLTQSSTTKPSSATKGQEIVTNI